MRIAATADATPLVTTSFAPNSAHSVTATAGTTNRNAAPGIVIASAIPIMCHTMAMPYSIACGCERLRNSAAAHAREPAHGGAEEQCEEDRGERGQHAERHLPRRHPARADHEQQQPRDGDPQRPLLRPPD